MHPFKKMIYMLRTGSSMEPPIGTAYTGVTMSATSDELTGNDACAYQLEIATTRYHSGELPDPIVGDIIFLDSGGAANFNGNNEWWKFDSAGIGFSSMKINTSGVVIVVQSCP